MSGRRRILHVENGLAFGGSCFSLLRLLEGLDLARYEPIVLLPASHPASDAFRATGVEVLSSGGNRQERRQKGARDIGATLQSVRPALGAGYRAARELWVLLRRDVPAAKRLSRLMREKAIDLVHHNDGPAANRASVLAAGWTGIPQICHVRAFEQLSFVERYLVRRVACLIYVSMAVERHCHTQRIRPAQGKVVYNPMKPETCVWNGDPGQVRAEFGWDERDRVVSNIGRLTWWKGQDDLLVALAEVLQREPRTKALIVGGVEPTYRDQDYAAGLQRLASSLGLAGNVVFTGFRRDVPAILAASDLIVHCPSEPEPFGLAVLEAMAAARPVIATAAGGIPEMIEHGVTGLLTPPRDTHAIADAMVALLANPKRAETLGRQAQSSVRARFSIARHASAIQDVYDACLCSPHPAGSAPLSMR